MVHYSNLNCAQYKTLCMYYTVTYHHGTSCFLITEDYSLRLIRIFLMATEYLASYRSNFITTIPDIFEMYSSDHQPLKQLKTCHSSLALLPN